MIDLISNSNELTFLFYIVLTMAALALMGLAEIIINKFRK